MPHAGSVYKQALDSVTGVFDPAHQFVAHTDNTEAIAF